MPLMKTRAVLLAVLFSLAPAVALAIPHATAPVNVLTKDSLIPEGTLFRIRMLTQLSSQYSRAGDGFSWVVSDDIKLGTRTVIPAGTLGFGVLRASNKAHGGNTPGSLRLAFYPITLTDGTKVDIAITRASLVYDENEKNGYAPAADDIANMALPYFFLFDALRKGPDQVIQKNAVFHVGVLEDVFVPATAVAVNATPPPPPTPSPSPTASAVPAGAPAAGTGPAGNASPPVPQATAPAPQASPSPQGSPTTK
jgi:hypothetical protein